MSSTEALAGAEKAKIYAMGVDGDCLMPEINDGDFVIADATLHPENGDFACIYWTDGRPPSVKRCTMVPPRSMMGVPAPGSEVIPIVILEMINPKRLGAFEVDKIAALHKVVEIVPRTVALTSGQDEDRIRRRGGAR